MVRGVVGVCECRWVRGRGDRCGEGTGGRLRVAGLGEW